MKPTPPSKRQSYKLAPRQERKYEKSALDAMRRREPETEKLLAAAKRKLPELKDLLAEMSGQWGYEHRIYRFYSGSFKLRRHVPPRTVRIVEALQALAPHLLLHRDFLQIAAEGTGNRFGLFRNVSEPKNDRAIVEAFFHAHHLLEMVCKYAEQLSEHPSMMPFGWATVLCLYNIR